MRAVVVLACALSVAVGVALVLASQGFGAPFWREGLFSLGIACVAAGGVSGLLEAAVEGAFERSLEAHIGEAAEAIKGLSQRVDEVKSKAAEQAQVLAGAAASGVKGVYATDEAMQRRAQEMLQDVTAAGSGPVWIMGTPWDAFFPPHRPGRLSEPVCKGLLAEQSVPALQLSPEPWERDVIGSEENPSDSETWRWGEGDWRHRARLRVLELDPYSDQAMTLRRAVPGALTNGSGQASAHEEAAGRAALQVVGALVAQGRLAARVSRVPLPCWALITAHSALFRAYAYADPASPGTPPPALEVLPDSPSYRALTRHFRSVWQEAPLSCAHFEITEGFAIGVGKGAWEAKLVNLYDVRDEAWMRIVHVLDEWCPPPAGDAHQTDPHVYLLGISLRDFFHPDRKVAGEPREALSRLLKKAADAGWTAQNPSVRALVLNPLGYQAMLRMMRENPDVAVSPTGWAPLKPELCRPPALLCGDVKKTLQFAGWRLPNAPIDVRCYTAAPGCLAVLIPGKALFVEQYHYGTPAAGVSGGQAPVLEFAPTAAFYVQMEAHLRFVWEISKGQGRDAMRQLLDDDKVCTDKWTTQPDDDFPPPGAEQEQTADA